MEVLVKTNLIISKIESDLRKSICEWLENLDFCKLQSYVNKALRNNGSYIVSPVPDPLESQVVQINLCSESHFITSSDCRVNDFEFIIHLFQTHNDVMQNNLEEDLPASFFTLLPSNSLLGLWESLVFDSSIRDDLLGYVQTSIMFANQKVNPAIITWNKVVLLFGPPGTGKTSLCKALAQKLSVVLYPQYQHIHLIEINSHSLFSKWFSESGKLVMKLFESIREFAEEESSLIFVLIDEVESLAYNRQRATASDPSDAIRVVNALLTQIDSIRRYPNVLILANSNVVETMDNAFVDRADIKQYIGLPSISCIYEIYRSCINELIHSEIVVNICEKDLLSYREFKNLESSSEPHFFLTEELVAISNRSQQFSGRTLRKIPFLAVALHSNQMIPIKLPNFLGYLKQTVEKQVEDNKYFGNDV